MSDVTISGSTLALFGLILGSVTACVSLLFRLLMQEKDRAYAAMKDDRDFWRQEHDSLQTTQNTTLRVISDTVAIIRTHLEDPPNRRGTAR